MRRRSHSHDIGCRFKETGSLGDPCRGQQCGYKIVALGNSGVGKTWLIERLTERQKRQRGYMYTSCYSDSSENSEAPESNGTIGVTFNLCKVRLLDVANQSMSGNKISRGCSSSIVLLHLWDTSGKPIYRNLVCNYLKGAHCVLLVYNPSEGPAAAQQALAKWYDFAIKETHRDAAATAGDSNRPDQAALPIIVALSNGACAYSLSEAAMAAVDFGRVFSSSLCGKFYLVQRTTSCMMPHHCAKHHLHRNRIQALIKQRLTPSLLAEVLLQRHRRQVQMSGNIPPSQQRLVLDGRARTDSRFIADEEEKPTKEKGCWWCHRVFGCGSREQYNKTI